MYQVMIADDEVIERMVLHKTLKKYLGDICEIHQAENGREALKIYEEKKIQIAILDIEMPGINGIQTAEKIRETDPYCSIIFLTAFDEFNYAKKAITVRALDYLLKPYQEEELLSVMEEAIRLTEKRKDERRAQSQAAAGQEGLRGSQEPRGPQETRGSQEMPDPQEPRGPQGSQGLQESRGPQGPQGLQEPAEGEGDVGESGYGRISKVSEIIRSYIGQHYMNDLSMQDVARMMNYSEAYFCKLFKQCFSCNFTAYLTQLRMEEAKKLLAEPTVNVKNVGEAVGYSDSNYFAKVFKRYTGSSPTEYRTELFQQK